MPYTVLDPTTAKAAPVLTVGNPLTSRGETLLSFEQELYYQLGGRDDVDSARLRRWINWGYIDVATSLEIEELNSSFALSLVATQPLYLMPSQLFSTIEVSLVDSMHPDGGYPLERMDISAYRGSPVVNDAPDGFFIHGEMMVIYPTPIQASTAGVDFRIRPNFMVNDTDSPLLQLEWHEAILIAAKEKAFDGLLEPDRAVAARNQWINIVRRRRDRMAEEDRGKHAGMTPVRHASQLRRFRRHPGLEPD